MGGKSEEGSFPSKSERLVCWGHRDDYFKCLDKNDDKEEPCANLRKLFVSNCPNMWVKHFDRKRRYEKFKNEMNSKGWSDPLEAPAGDSNRAK